MKSLMNKFMIGIASLLTLAGTSCTDDLEQMPKDPNLVNVGSLKSDPEQYIGGIFSKCYSGLAVASQEGQSGESDISGVDGGSSQWTRVVEYLEEMPTDVMLWIWSDEGVPDLVYGTWDAGNKFVYCAYSRFYSHIATCNEFLRLCNNLGGYGISLDAEMTKNVEQFKLEARALRDLTYFYVIDMFGPATVAWDDLPYGATPPQAESREVLYNKVVADLEDVEANFPEDTPVYGRIGVDAVRALLAKYYLNAEVFTGKPAYDKCWAMCQKIIKKHQGGGYDNSGLAMDYLSLFCGSNKMFMPGGDLSSQNEILWGVPYNQDYTVSWGGSVYAVLAWLYNGGDVDPVKGGKGFCVPSWYGVNDAWGCAAAREEFSKKFGFVNGESIDDRTTLWLTEKAGFSIQNAKFGEVGNGYDAIKFTNVNCNADGTMPRFTEERFGIPFTRVGVQPVEASTSHPNTCMPVLRLADVYLMATESAIRGAAGSDMGEALRYVNYVRRRAGVSSWTTADLTLDNILDERARELYQEATRRTDLIRFGKFVSGYTWSWKGQMRNGVNLRNEGMNLYPFPTNVKAIYGNDLTQNPGY